MLQEQRWDRMWNKGLKFYLSSAILYNRKREKKQMWKDRNVKQTSVKDKRGIFQKIGTYTDVNIVVEENFFFFTSFVLKSFILCDVCLSLLHNYILMYSVWNFCLHNLGNLQFFFLFVAVAIEQTFPNFLKYNTLLLKEICCNPPPIPV